MNLVGTLTAAWDMVRTFETAEIPIGGIMDAAYVLLSGQACWPLTAQGGIHLP